MYYKNNSQSLANSYIFTIFTDNNLKNPSYLEYRLRIQDILTCDNIVINAQFIRSLTYNEVLSNSNNYIPYFDGINIDRNLSNCGINIINAESNEELHGPYSDIFQVVVKNNETFQNIESIDWATILYRRYQNILGAVNYSYLVKINEGYCLEYSIHFFYAPSSNCSINNIRHFYYLNNSNILDPNSYAIQNNYTNAFNDLPNSKRMHALSLYASNPNIISNVNNILTTFSRNPAYSNNVFSIQEINTDYTNQRNNYKIAEWPSNTEVTLDDLINISPSYLKYYVSLSNIQTATSYTIIYDSNLDFFDDNDTSYTKYNNNVYIKNGIQYRTDFYELSYSQSNCFSAYNASNLMTLFSDMNIKDAITESDYSTGTMTSFVAFKNNSVRRSYDYILEIQIDVDTVYAEVYATLRTVNEPSSCSAYIDEQAFDFTFTRVIGLNELGTYLISNNYFTNVDLQSISYGSNMIYYNLTATNPTFISLINNKLSNLVSNAVYSENIVSLQYTKTDYRTLTNRYLVAFWQPNTPITFNGLLNSERNYIEYTINLSNIQGSNNFNIISSSIPTIFTGNLSRYTKYLNNIYYKNGVRYEKPYYDLTYSASNCSILLNPTEFISSLDNQNVRNILRPPSYSNDLSFIPFTRVVAYKKNSSTNTFSYIIHLSDSETSWYPEISISLINGEQPNCTNYTMLSESYDQENNPIITTQYNTNFVSMVNTNNLNNFILSNGYTIYNDTIITDPELSSFDAGAGGGDADAGGADAGAGGDGSSGGDGASAGVTGGDGAGAGGGGGGNGSGSRSSRSSSSSSSSSSRRSK